MTRLVDCSRRRASECANTGLLRWEIEMRAIRAKNIRKKVVEQLGNFRGFKKAYRRAKKDYSLGLLTLLFLFAFFLAGCASHTVDIKYYDVSPKYTGAAVFAESGDPLGVNAKCIDRYIIDKDGNVQPVKQDSASAPGPVAGITQSLVTSGAATATAGAILPLLLPTSSTTVNTTKSK